jgi:PAS domain S-box-containing protein
MKDEHGRYVYASKTFLTRYGKRFQDRLGKTDFDIWPREIAERFRENDQAVLSTGRAMEFTEETEETLSPEGKPSCWRIFKFPFEDSSGRRYVGGIGVDITAQKIAQEALRESEARFREFAEALPQVVYELDTQGNIMFVNNAGLALGGYDREDLDKGVTIKDLVAPEDWEKLFENIRKVAQGESTLGTEYTLIMKDGTRVPIAAYSTPIVRESKVVGARGVCVDIRRLKEAEEVLKCSHEDIEKLVAERTADLESVNEQLRREIGKRTHIEEQLAQSEARFRGIFETAPDCVFIKDLSLRYTFVNPAMATLLEMPQAEILGKRDDKLFGAAASEHLKSVDARALKGDVVEEEHTLEVRGSHLTFLAIKAPLTDTQGQIVGICGIARDITERRSLESLRAPVKVGYESPAMRAAVVAAELAATTDSTVLLMGESGSGKDYLARYIHERSRRSAGPFYAINCASIPTELAESELFGHEAGAFTGASKRKRGLLELAEGGTILLNEIGELPLDIQAKLLAFLDTRSFTRVGGERDVTVNVRLIAATNRDLAKDIAEGRFRKDLFYRLDVFAIRVPPLRERLDDLAVLAEEQLSKLTSRYGSGRGVQLGPGVMELLKRYGWPGNVRELRNVLERALILSRGGPLRPEHFQFGRLPVQTLVAPTLVSMQKPLPDLLGDIERYLIEDALDRSRGNRTEAAAVLGISRFALTRHMRKLGFS